MKSCPTCRAHYPGHFAVCPTDGTALVEAGTWSEGTLVRGKYRILSKVGQGGMGTVYKALHMAFDELRALKVMNAALLTDELFVRRFKQEAVVTRKLQHRNAVRVDDIDESEDGLPFIVMEYIEGQSLKTLVQKQGAIPVGRACAIIKQAADALDAAHRLGMVHRDIKPDNIVLVTTSEGEQAKVLDFGIAKLKETRAGTTKGHTLTGTGIMIGTPQYMSPEQAMGKRGDDLDGRSDLYSLGIVMYEMLTGKLPYKADTTMEMVLAHLQQEPTPIRKIRPDLQIPEGIAALVMRCLEKNPEFRPASATALIEAIDLAEKSPVLAGTLVIQAADDRSGQPEGYSPQAAAQALRESLRQMGKTPVPGSMQSVPQGHAPDGAWQGGPAQRPPLNARAPDARSGPRPAVSPPVPPPQIRPPALEPRKAPQAPAAARPVPPAPAESSHVDAWVFGAFLILGAAGGAWYITSRSSSVGSQPPSNAVKSTPPETVAPKKDSVSSPPPVVKAGTKPLLEISRVVARGKIVEVSGRTDPGSQVNVNDERVSSIAQDGSFRHLTSPFAKPGTHELRITAQKADGGTVTVLKSVVIAKTGNQAAAEAPKVAPPQTAKAPELPKKAPEAVSDPKKVAAAIAMGDVYFSRGEYDKAIQEYESGLRLDPSNASLQEKLTRVRKAKAAEERVTQ